MVLTHFPTESEVGDSRGLLAFTGFLSSFMSPVNQLVGLGQTVQEMETQMERIEDVMGYEADVPEGCESPEEVGGLKEEFGRELDLSPFWHDAS